MGIGCLHRFERAALISCVIADGLSLEEFYGAGAHKHPPTLTRTERTRFIRSYYLIWSLMRLDPSKWEPRLQAMTSQELYYLREMANLTQSIGREEDVPPPMFPDQPPDSFHSINQGRSEKRIALEEKIWEQVQRNSRQFFDRDAQDTSIYAKHEGFLCFVVMWDHWQPSLKDIVCHQSVSTIRLSPEVVSQYLWNDGLDE